MPQNCGGDHPSGPAIAGGLKQLPVNSGGQPSIIHTRTHGHPARDSCLAPSGVYPATPVTWSCWCALTAPFHPYPASWAVYFLLHLPAHCCGLLLATTVPCGVRTFLESVPAHRCAVALFAITQAAHSQDMTLPPHEPVSNTGEESVNRSRIYTAENKAHRRKSVRSPTPWWTAGMRCR